MKSKETKRICLGDYIEKIERPNRDLKYGIEDVYGVTNTKQLIKGTKANLTGRTFEKFSIVEPREFIFNRRTTRNGEKISIGFNQLGKNVILTEDYCHFKVRPKLENVLFPEYLYLYFTNPEFDRYARYDSWGSATEFFNWENMCNVKMYIPSLEEQQKIVRQYKTITDRIEVLEKINEELEKQMTLIYRNMFDDDANFSDGTISDFGDIVSGATPSTEVPEYFVKNGIAWITPKDLTSTGLKFIYRGETDITETAYKSCSTKNLPAGTVLFTSRAPVGTVGIAMNDICTNQGFKSIVPNKGFAKEYIYFFLKENKSLIESNASGTTFAEISGKVFGGLPIKIPNKEIISKFSTICRAFFEEQARNEKEICMLKELKGMITKTI